MTTNLSRSDERAARPSVSGRPTAKEPLQVRIPTSVKRRFKAHAALRGIEPNQLFVEIWEHYEDKLKAVPTTAET